jgi:hypothetical protein
MRLVLVVLALALTAPVLAQDVTVPVTFSVTLTATQAAVLDAQIQAKAASSGWPVTLEQHVNAQAAQMFTSWLRATADELIKQAIAARPVPADLADTLKAQADVSRAACAAKVEAAKAVPVKIGE